MKKFIERRVRPEKFGRDLWKTRKPTEHDRVVLKVPKVDQEKGRLKKQQQQYKALTKLNI